MGEPGPAVSTRDSLFDARLFQITLQNVAVADRDVMAVKLRNPDAVRDAISALNAFSKRASDFFESKNSNSHSHPRVDGQSTASRADPIDVVFHYSRVSPNADELFHALRAASKSPALTIAALNALVAIARYACQENRSDRPNNLIIPVERDESDASSVLAARVLTHVVKSRAAHVYSVFVSGRSDCIRIALNLLNSAANHNPQFSREIMSRFDLTSKSFAPALCTVRNHRCRLPFITLITSLMYSEDPYVTGQICADSRSALLACLQVTVSRLHAELAHGHELSKRQNLERNDVFPSHRPNLNVVGKKSQAFQIFPSNVQKRELQGAIRLLNAVENLVKRPIPPSQNSMLTASPFCGLIAEIATAARPSLSVVPRNVQHHHVNLRTAAKRLLIALLNTQSVSPSRIATVLSSTPSEQIESDALTVLAEIVQAYPPVACAVLASGRLLSLPPELSSRWIGIVSLMALCLQVTMMPVGTFVQCKFFKDSLGHESALVRHWGLLIALALTRSVLNDPKALKMYTLYLPPLKDIYDCDLTASPSESVVQKLLTAYQFVYSVSPGGPKMDMVQEAIKISENNFCSAEDAIRLSLDHNPYALIPKLIENHQLSGIIIQATNSNNVNQRDRLWHLAADLIKSTDLFPQGTQFEIDIYLAVLSSIHKDDLSDCAKEFESILHLSTDTAYEAFDELHGVRSGQPNPFPRASLLVVQLCSRLRSILSKSKKRSTPTCPPAVAEFLQEVVLLIFACDEVISGHVFTSSYLARALPTIFDSDAFPWTRTNNLTEEDRTRLQVCRHVRLLFGKPMRYMQTPFLSLVKRYVTFREFLMSEKDARIRSWKVGVHLGLLWNSLLEASKHYPAYSPTADPGIVLYRGKLNERDVDWGDFGALLLEANSFHLPDWSSEDSFFKLRQQLPSSEFFFLVTTIFRTTKMRKSRKAALQIVVDTLREYHDDPQHIELCAFARSSLIEGFQAMNTLDFYEVEIVLDFSIDTLSEMESVEQHHSELLSFCLEVLHSATFHSSHEICVRTRYLLGIRSLRTFPPLYLLPIASVEHFVKIYHFFPELARIVDDQLLSLSYETCSKFRFDSIHIFDAVLSGARNTQENFSLHEWKDSCRRLLKTKQFISVKEPKLVRIIREDQYPTFCKLVQEWGLLSIETINAEVKCLVDEYASGTETGSFRIFSWIALAHMCRRGLQGLNFTEPIEDLLSMLNLFASALCDVEIRYDDSLLFLVFTVFHAYLQQTYFLVENFVQNGTRFRISGRMLRKLGHAFARAICSWMRNDFESSETESHDLKYAWDSSVFELILQCLNFMVLLGTVDLSDLEKVLLSLKRNYFRYVFKRCGNESETSTETMSTSTVITVCDLLNAATVCFDNSCPNEELAHVFGSAQALLSSQYVGFSAKASERDISVRKCQSTIDRFLSRSDSFSRFSLVRRGRGFFYQKASKVLQNFDMKSLSSARMDVYAWSYQSRGGSAGLTQTAGWMNMYDRSSSTDSEFLLRVLFAACREALDFPERPVLDLEKVAKDGVLAVAITALSVSCEEVRQLGYACLQLFTEVVGPISNVSRGAAAGLYQDRRQLSFLLQLLRNAIENAAAQILPLFAAWFSTALGVALSPSHPNNNHVTYFMLRNAILDTSDCDGVINLLHGEGNEIDVKSMRLLALEVLEKGVQTAPDMVVVRKRKLIESLFFLASSADVPDPTVRMKALKVMEVLVRREARLRIVRELHDIHGIVGWLGCEGLGARASTLEEFTRKTKLLSGLAKHMNGDVDFMKEASQALSMLLTRTVGDEDSEKFDASVASSAIICAEAVARVAQMQTQVFETDFVRLWHRAKAQFKGSHCVGGVSWQRALFVILRQTPVGEIDDEIIEAALTERVELLEGGTYAQVEEEYPSEVLVIDAFISRVLVFRMERRNQSVETEDGAMDTSTDEANGEQRQNVPQRKAQSVAGHQTYGLIARSLERCTTIWMTIAGLCAVTAYGKVDEQLQTLAGDVPAWPPSDVSVSCTRSYAKGVQALKTPLINSLLKIVEQ